jgi:sortase (surface protein transpeptidase)
MPTARVLRLALGATAGLALLAIAVAVRPTAPTPVDAGVLPTARASTPRVSSTSATGQRPRRRRSLATPAPGSVRTHDARLSHQPTAVPQAPRRVLIDALGVDAPVVPYDTTADGAQLALPADARRVAWYRDGSAPGEAGSAVLAAHVDFGGQRGVFFALRRLPIGARIRIERANGSSRAYRVVARRQYRKARLPGVVFSTTGRPRLVLITCGGRFDPRTHHYEENVVVYALPVASEQE